MPDSRGKFPKTCAWDNAPRKMAVDGFFASRKTAIGSVLMSVSNPQITQSVVRSVSVDMINHISFRKNKTLQDKNDSVNEVKGILSIEVKSDAEITSRVEASGLFPAERGVEARPSFLGWEVIQRSLFPLQLPCIRVVLKTLFKKLPRGKTFDFSAFCRHCLISVDAHSGWMGSMLGASGGSRRPGLCFN